MILLGVGLSIAVVVFVGFLVSKRIAGDSANFLVAGRTLALALVGGPDGPGRRHQRDARQHGPRRRFGFWAGACLPLGWRSACC